MSDPVYRYEKGKGWVASFHRSAEETKGLPWHKLETGDAVYVYDAAKLRVGKVHRDTNPEPLNEGDHGGWYRGAGVSPFSIHNFGNISEYAKKDRAWTELEGISFPGGKDYE
jgi:hypothetical protein